MTNTTDQRPYVVSGDIYLLLSEWAKRKRLNLPKKEFFSSIRNEFLEKMLKIFPSFEFIAEEEIVDGMKNLTSKLSWPIISLSTIYMKSDWTLNFTRMVDFSQKELGLFSRFGLVSAITQFKKLSYFKGSKVLLTDDVIFSGSLVCRLVPLLEKFGIKVTAVISGVGVQNGISKVKKFCDVYCVKTYNEVIDQVCERDFYPGVPYCGRSIRTKPLDDRDIGYPYIWPFCNSEKWSSVPNDKQYELSKFCLEQTIRIFEMIESVSRRPVYYGEIDRQIARWPFMVIRPQDRFVDTLKHQLDILKGESCDFDFDPFCNITDIDC